MRFSVAIGKVLGTHIGAGDATLSFDIRISIVTNLKKPMKSDELARFIEISDAKVFLSYIAPRKPHSLAPLALLSTFLFFSP